MQTTPIKLTDANAREIYPTAPAEIKRMLEDSFPTGFFSMNITDRIQGWADILSITGANAEDYQLRPGETDDELAYREGKLISLAYNGKILSLEQDRHFPYHLIIKDPSKPSGFALSYYYYVYWYTNSSVGVRLCFDSPDKAIDAGNKFIPIYERLKIR